MVTIYWIPKIVKNNVPEKTDLFQHKLMLFGGKASQEVYLKTLTILSGYLEYVKNGLIYCIFYLSHTHAVFTIL
jgi:hypothetical protein